MRVFDMFYFKSKKPPRTSRVIKELSGIYTACKRSSAWQGFIVMSVGFSHSDMGFGNEFFECSDFGTVQVFEFIQIDKHIIRLSELRYLCYSD